MSLPHTKRESGLGRPAPGGTIPPVVLDELWIRLLRLDLDQFAAVKIADRWMLYARGHMDQPLAVEIWAGERRGIHSGQRHLVPRNYAMHYHLSLGCIEGAVVLYCNLPSSLERSLISPRSLFSSWSPTKGVCPPARARPANALTSWRDLVNQQRHYPI